MDHSDLGQSASTTSSFIFTSDYIFTGVANCQRASHTRATLHSQSGRTYTVQEVLAEQRAPLLRVYRARYDTNPILSSSDAALIIRSADGQNFIVKNVIPGEYKYQQDLQKPLASCPNLRTVVDGLPSCELFIHRFLEPDFLQFGQKNLTEATRRSMLKSALVGLATLHERNIIHTGRLSISLYLSFAKP